MPVSIVVKTCKICGMQHCGNKASILINPEEDITVVTVKVHGCPYCPDDLRPRQSHDRKY